jgi:hypothetical protein
MRMRQRKKRKLRRRLREQSRRLLECEGNGRDAVVAEREALTKSYWHEIRRRVFVLDTPLAWELALEVKEFLGIDLTPRLTDLLHKVMKPDGPRPANGKVAKLMRARSL